MESLNTEELNRGLLDFISKTPNSFFAVKNISEALGAAGFAPLDEGAYWANALRPGGKIYVTRNGSSLIAFRLPERKDWKGFQILAAHGDSPAFRLKPDPALKAEGGYARLNVEGYGGMICSTWFDRPLSLAGRVLVRTAEGARTRLVNLDRDLLLIPNLAIHMDRSVNDGYKYNVQRDLLPLLAEGDGGGLMGQIAAAAECEAADILDSDLFLYNRQPGTLFGLDREFLAAPRLDDLQCAYAALRGFLESAEPRASVPVYCLFDNEEVGSGTKQGAASTFLRDVLSRLHRAGGGAPEEFSRRLADSFMVSADNAHALHPNRPDKADPVNRPRLNGGIVIKYSANQKYATDAVSGGLFRLICERAGVPIQTFANRSDVPGGSTLGNISNTQVALNTVDIGLPQLAMHSAYETAGAKDTAFLAAAAREFFSCSIQSAPGGEYRIL